MPSTSFRRRALARAAVPLAAAVMATGVAAAMATPAAASNSYNGNAYVSGTGTPLDDLNDEGAVNKTTNTLSNVTCLWQNILYADGYLTVSGIDGSFGPDTYDATKKWQGDHGLAADGSAGKDTFKKAGTKLDWYLTLNGVDYLTYDGKKSGRQVSISRPDAGGNWSFDSADGRDNVKASYNSRTCS